jgi:sodium transport system permease protein
MSQPGSVPTRPLHPFPAIVVTLVGVSAMFLSAAYTVRAGIGIRPQIALGTLALVLPSLVVVLAVGSARQAAFGARLIGRRTVLLSVLLGGALWVGSVGLMEMQSLLLPPPEQYLQTFRSIHEALAPTGPIDALVSLTVIALLPGLCEELVVRGVLLPSLASRIPPFLAVLASAGLFAAMHADLYRFLFTFAIGMVLGFLRLSAASLWPAVLAHASLNTLTFVIAPYVDDPSQGYTPEPLLGIACLLAGSLALVPLLRRLSARRAPGERAAA